MREVQMTARRARSQKMQMTPIKTNPNQIVGIMADSHGRFNTIADALSLFKEHGCEAIYHLGDICDSAHPETADHCISLLRENNVFGIKGNNDHQVVVNNEGRQNAHLASITIDYLKHLPLTIEIGDTLLAHSLPFAKERGLSSMVGVMGPREAILFFRTYPHTVMFRGHSHYPEILRQQNHTLMTQKILPGESIQLADMNPSIITCGALDQGFTMIWDSGRRTIMCQTLTKRCNS
jgi:predicted phosphodiesterase